jgi:tRNA threonylcarbamoyladenosine biosynthesis protein TsaB
VSNDELIKDELLILAIETATRAGGVAVARGQDVLASIVGDAAVSHSSNLIEMVESVLHAAGLTLNQVDLFAVAVGPGSFTGLRIGLATVKAFAVHLDRQAIGVSTLAAVAHAAGVNGGVVSLLPAGRGAVFAQRFVVDDGKVSALDEPQHLSPAAVMEKYAASETLTLAGEGVRIIENFVTPPSGGSDGDGSWPSKGGTPNLWTMLSASPPLAASIALLGSRAYGEGKAVAPDDLHAVYVRASDAEINERWQQQKRQQQAPS